MDIRQNDPLESNTHNAVSAARVHPMRIIVLVGIILLIIASCLAWSMRHDESAARPAPVNSSSYYLGRMYWDIPDVKSLLGMSTLDAIKAIGHGAAVRDDTVGYDKNEPEDARRVTIALADEWSKDGPEAPTVVLWTRNGRVIQAAYSSSLQSYGFSTSLTFAEAIEEAHVVELGLREAGISVARSEVSLPADKLEYSRYQDDGRTLVQESLDFEGKVEDANPAYAWFAALDYDYSEAIEMGNLIYTHRVLSVGARIL